MSSSLESITARPCYICDKRLNGNKYVAEMPICRFCEKSYGLIDVTPRDDVTQPAIPNPLGMNLGGIGGYGMDFTPYQNGG